MYARLQLFIFTLVCCLPAGASAAIADFENLPLPPDSFYNGDPGGLMPGQTHDGSFVSGGARFNNLFAVDATFGYTYWNGWAYSNKTDTTTAGFGNQYSAYAGGGSGGSAKYGVAFMGAPAPAIELPAGAMPVSIDVTNTTYAALSMLFGDSFSKRFGDNTATPQVFESDFPDFFKLTIGGVDAGGGSIGAPVEVYLADYRFANSAEDYIQKGWKTINLSSLAGAAKLTFALQSSDVGQFGMNTPGYFAADNLVTNVVPEPSGWALLLAAVVVLAASRLLKRSAFAGG